MLGGRFGSIPQAISYWGHSSFPNCSGSFSNSISWIFCHGCLGVFRFAGCELPAGGFTSRSWPCLSHTSALCPGCCHFRQSRSRMLRLNPSGERLSLGRLLKAFRSIASSPWVAVRGWYVPLRFLGTSCFFVAVVDVLCPGTCRTGASFISFSITQLARATMLVYLSLEAPHVFCSFKFIPPSAHSPAVQ